MVLPQIHEALASHPQFTSFDLILSSRVPVLKFKSKQGNVKFDITVNNTAGPHSTALVIQWVSRYPQLKPVALVLKAFLASHDFDAVYTGGMSGFAVLNMIVSLLQQHPLLVDDKSLNLGRIVYQFFKTYGLDFDYERLAISTRLQAYIPKPPQVIYPSSPTSPATPENIRLYIEDPTHTANNVCKSTFRMAEIKRSFAQVYETLTQLLESPTKDSILDIVARVDPEVETERLRICAEWRKFSSSLVYPSSYTFQPQSFDGTEAAVAKSRSLSSPGVGNFDGEKSRNRRHSLPECEGGEEERKETGGSVWNKRGPTFAQVVKERGRSNQKVSL